MEISIQNFIDEAKVNGTKPATIRTYVTVLSRADDYKHLSKDWTREDVNSFIISLNNTMPTKNPSFNLSLTVQKSLSFTRMYTILAGKSI